MLFKNFLETITHDAIVDVEVFDGVNYMEYPSQSRACVHHEFLPYKVSEIHAQEEGMFLVFLHKN